MREERLKLFKDLYGEILFGDSDWHFFYEAEFGDFLRVGDEYLSATIDYLDQYIVNYEHDGEWVETLPFVAANINYFSDMFHMNTLFALEYSGDTKYLYENLHCWTERYSHSLHDMLHLVLGSGTLENEASRLARSALDRARYDGYRQRYLEVEQRKESRREDGDKD